MTIPRQRIAGASERDIVHSGLEQVMEMATKGVLETAFRHDLGLDIRTAAYIYSIEKILKCYENQGTLFN